MTEFIGNEDYVYRRDSFECRICDDLCPVILKYLSIYDKIRFECISKQFKSCIFIKQNVLKINTKIERDFYDIERHIFDDMMDGKTSFKIINLITFESILLLLLKKCKFITDIKFNPTFDYEESVVDHMNHVLRLITKYCKHLKVFDFKYKLFDKEVIKSFGKTFGQSLRHIKFDRYFEGKSALIKLFPNLVIIENVMFDDMVSENEVIVLKKLKHIVIDYSIAFRDYFLNTFIINYDKIFKSVEYELCLSDKILKQLSNLESFEIFVYDNYVNLNILSEIVKIVTNHCKQLKCLRIISKQSFPDILKSISQLKHLKSLSVICNNDFEIIHKSIDLKDCKQLTELKLKDKYLGIEFFHNIDKHLPQLKCLEIYSLYNTVCKQSLTSLSKLINLKKLVVILIDTNESIDDIILELINNNKQIECIELSGDYVMTEESINALISLAVKRNKTQFNHKFFVGENAIKYGKKFENKPINLFIKFEDYYDI